MKPCITMRIGNRFIQLMSHDVGHCISAFIPVRTEALGGTTRSIGYGRASGGRVSHKSNFYVYRVDRSNRAGGVKAAVSSAKASGSCGETHIRRREKEIDSVGIHGKSPVIKRLADRVRKRRVV